MRPVRKDEVAFCLLLVFLLFAAVSYHDCEVLLLRLADGAGGLIAGALDWVIRVVQKIGDALR